MKEKKHSGDAKQCPVCKNSKATRCIKCGHVLTGKVDSQGRTTCENCGEHIWLGVGNYND